MRTSVDTREEGGGGWGRGRDGGEDEKGEGGCGCCARGIVCAVCGVSRGLCLFFPYWREGVSAGPPPTNMHSQSETEQHSPPLASPPRRTSHAPDVGTKRIPSLHR